MKKSVFLCLFLLLFISQYEYHDMSSYTSDTKTIEVKGAVKQEGVLEVAHDATIAEILDMVQISETADISSLNLTYNLENHGVLVVPEQMDTSRVSINTADIEQLDSLPGIGRVVAQRIIDYRAGKPFQSVEELKNVKGIGDKLFEKLQDAICL